MTTPTSSSGTCRGSTPSSRRATSLSSPASSTGSRSTSKTRPAGTAPLAVSSCIHLCWPRRSGDWIRRASIPHRSYIRFSAGCATGLQDDRAQDEHATQGLNDREAVTEKDDGERDRDDGLPRTD